MRRYDDKNWIMGLLWLVATLIALAAIFYDPVGAQEEAATVCQDAADPTRFIFHVPSAWNNPELPSWWALGSGYEMLDETTIVVTALYEWGNYGEGYPDWQQTIMVGQALVGSGDYSSITVGDQNTAVCGVVATITPPLTENAGNGLVEPLAMLPIINPIVSTGRTCVVKYPQAIVVCNG